MHCVTYRILNHQPGANDVSFHGAEEWWLMDTAMERISRVKR